MLPEQVMGHSTMISYGYWTAHTSHQYRRRKSVARFIRPLETLKPDAASRPCQLSLLAGIEHDLCFAAVVE